MARGRTGVTAAAILPSALGAAMLVGAPLSSATADNHSSVTVQKSVQQSAVHDKAAALAPMKFDVPARAIFTLVGAQLMLVGVGAGVIVVARRKHEQDA